MASTRTKRRRAAKLAQATQKRKLVNATRYDVLTDSNLNSYWRWTDSRSVDASLDQETRRKLRERARYEVANNSYALGVALALADAVIGGGPRLQVIDKSFDTKTIERDFEDWQEEIRLCEKLRAMRFARFQDGESFAVFCNNPRLKHDVKLDIVPLDCERVAGEYGVVKQNDVDGIELDAFGNPLRYRVLTNHPGNYETLADIASVTYYDAKDIIHWFRKTTPEQHRGCTELAASLNLFALLRRYTLAVVTAAETAADVAAVMFTDLPDAGTEQGTPFETVNLERGLMTTLPDGWKMSQLKAEQPTTTYREFKREVLAEIGRSLHMPLNVMSGDSSSYNYASGRLDHQEYIKSVRNDQKQCAITVMKPIFKTWWREYALIKGVDKRPPQVTFYWDGFEHVDPVKEAQAQAIRLANNTTNLSIEYAKQGLDWEDELEQRGAEMQQLKELGLYSNQNETKAFNENGNEEI